MSPPHAARQLWAAAEPYHAVVYFAPDARAALDEVGLKGFWMGYFASRAAPLGPVPPEVVTACFFVFHPDKVRRAIPDAWSRAAPDTVLAARLALADRTLRQLLGDDVVSSPDVARAAALARRAAEAGEVEGRGLFAAHAALPWPDEPHLALWQAATLLREHRGDGHVATLLHAGLDGCQAQVLAAASGATTAELQAESRGWSAEEWGGAVDSLRARGWVDGDGALTAAGADAKAAIEDRTDELASSPTSALAGDGLDELLATLRRLRERIVAGGGVPFPNPIGLPS